MCGDSFLIVTTWGGVMASSGLDPGMLLNILQRTGQQPELRVIRPQRPVVPGLRTPGPVTLTLEWILGNKPELGMRQ